MNPKYEWLDKQIDHMQADERLDAYARSGFEPKAEDISLVQMASFFSSQQQGKSKPRQEFLDSLRDRILEASGK